jgi:hypothetical protein
MGERKVMDKLKISFEINYKLAVIGLVITIAAVFLYLYFPKECREVYLSVLSIIAVGIALTGFLYRVFQIHIALEQKSQELTFNKIQASANLISQWHSPEMAKLTVLAGELRLEANTKSPKQVSDILESSRDKKEAVVCLLNFLEKMALMVHLDAVDKDSCKRFFSVIVADYHFAFSDYIGKIRKTSKEDNIFIEFSNLHKEWQENK